MKKYIVIVLIAYLGILVSCSESAPHPLPDSETINIELSPGFNQGIFSLDSLFDSVRYVQLELTKESAFQNLFFVKTVEDKILLLSFMPELVLVFDENGRYFGNVGKKGKGPGEYNGLADVLLNPYSGKLEVLTNYPPKILRFDLETLTYLDETVLPSSFYMQKFYPTGDNTYIFNNLEYAERSGEWRYRFLLFDDKEKIFSKKWISLEDIQPQGSSFLPRFNFFPTQSSLYSTALNSRYIYELDTGGVRISHMLSFNEADFDSTVIMDSKEAMLASINSDNACCLLPFVITDDYIWGGYRFLEEWGERFFYSRASKKVIEFTALNTNNPFNAIDFEIPPVGFTNDEVIFQLSPYIFQEISERDNHRLIPKEKEKVLKFAQSMEEEGGPILIFYKFKSF